MKYLGSLTIVRDKYKENFHEYINAKHFRYSNILSLFIFMHFYPLFAFKNTSSIG